MNLSDMESSSIPKRTSSPVPPPYPRQGLAKRRTSCKRQCCPSSTNQDLWDNLFDEGYRADVLINTDHGGVIHAHANILGMASPVLRSILRRNLRGNKHKSISISGAPPEAVHVFIRFLYSSRYEENKFEEYALPLLVLSHAYAVPQLKQECEKRLEQGLITSENVIDIFQLAILCDAPRLSIIAHRFILKNIKSVRGSEGWKAMKKSHPGLEKEIIETIYHEETFRKAKMRKIKEKEIYKQLYEAMEALVHICRDGCRTIGPHDKNLKANQEPCEYEACKGLESLVRHFAGCSKRVSGRCIHCKRMWQLLELHSRLCANPSACKVPLCRNHKHRRQRHKKKDDWKWNLLVKKIVRSKSISGAPYFSLEST